MPLQQAHGPLRRAGVIASVRRPVPPSAADASVRPLGFARGACHGRRVDATVIDQAAQRAAVMPARRRGAWFRISTLVTDPRPEIVLAAAIIAADNRPSSSRVQSPGTVKG